jgi:hypothetical protein
MMIFSPEGNIITEGNISPNPPSGGSIKDILIPKIKGLQVENIKLATYLRELNQLTKAKFAIFGVLFL